MSAYEDARKAYWNAQSEFRRVAINQIIDLIPEGMAGAVLEINDTPRLALSHFIREGDGQSISADAFGEEVEAEIDGIANDMEAGTWDEAESFLARCGDESFIVERESIR